MSTAPQEPGREQSFLQQVHKLSRLVAQAGEGLQNQSHHAASADGHVTVTVDGKGRLLALTIAPEAADPEKADELAATVIEAMSRAATLRKVAAQQQLAPAAQALITTLDEQNRALRALSDGL